MLQFNQLNAQDKKIVFNVSLIFNVTQIIQNQNYK